jgi:hypothetical protein
MKNFAIIDSPGDTENDQYLQFFASKGYIYSKMLIYFIDEGKLLDADAMRNNKNLEKLIELKINYKIPLLILLTHFDDYCDRIKKDVKCENWKENCKRTYEDNKNNLMKYINEEIIINKFNNNSIKIEENDIEHIVLVEPKKVDENEIIKKLPPKKREKYLKADEEEKKEILEWIFSGIDFNNDEVQDFLDNEIKIVRPKDLIKKMKQILPSQYCNALKQMD